MARSVCALLMRILKAVPSKNGPINYARHILSCPRSAVEDTAFLGDILCPFLGDERAAERTRHQLQVVLVRRIQRDPEAIHERSLLASLLARAGQGEAAIAQAERAVALDPKDGRALYNAACTYGILGRVDEAMAHLRQAVSGLPSYVAEWPKNDPDLELVRAHPDWIELFGEPDS